MKKTAILFLSLLSATSLFAQDIRRNPATPLNSDAGRVLELEKLLEFDDSSGDFSFKHPYEIHADSQGNFYVLEGRPSRLLKFTPDGKFLGDLIKPGQGQGAIDPRRLARVVIWRDEFYLSDGLSKIVHLDKDGRFVGESRTTQPRPYHLLDVSEKGYYVTGLITDWDKTGLVDSELEVLLVLADGKFSKKVAGFTTQSTVGTAPGGRNRGFSWVDQSDHTLYFSHALDYEVFKADLDGQGLLFSFARDYPKVKSERPSPSLQGAAAYKPDVIGVFVCDHYIWVKTTTEVEGKGCLFDVFDPNGRYVDSFFLRGCEGHRLFPASGGFLYTLSQSPEDTWVVKKFRILNGPKAPSRP